MLADVASALATAESKLAILDAVATGSSAVAVLTAESGTDGVMSFAISTLDFDSAKPSVGHVVKLSFTLVRRAYRGPH